MTNERGGDLSEAEREALDDLERLARSLPGSP
jgi:hypothetical protein